MTTVLLEAETMAAKSVSPDRKPMGPLLARNLFRLGKADIVVRSTEIAKDVTASTGVPMSRQRISALMNAVHIEPETIEMIAKALKVKPSELLKDVSIEVK